MTSLAPLFATSLLENVGSVHSQYAKYQLLPDFSDEICPYLGNCDRKTWLHLCVVAVIDLCFLEQFESPEVNQTVRISQHWAYCAFAIVKMSSEKRGNMREEFDLSAPHSGLDRAGGFQSQEGIPNEAR
jgi:hypothetical protein